MFYNPSTIERKEPSAVCVFGTKPMFNFKTKRFGAVSVYSVVKELINDIASADNQIGNQDGYFISSDGEAIRLNKRLDEKLKNKTEMVLVDFDKPDKSYLRTYYPEYKINHEIVLGAGRKKQVTEIEIHFLRNENGTTSLGIKAPELFQEAIKNIVNLAL
jgi:hypothetical protein